ncbi:hypothetical protein GCM10023187_51120 [Nibrella viscosa]|uniref:Uncharacterized protein n=1 Tax=Nibrella viscosa TaxID=1084524 RepID=A0ABP8KWS6_9BACT
MGTYQELISRIRRGDQKAFEIVYKMNRPVILRYVLQNHGTAYRTTVIATSMLILFKSPKKSTRVTKIPKGAFCHTISGGIYLL